MQTKENVIRTGLQTVLIAGALLALNPPQATAAGAHENTLHALNQKNIVRCHVTDQNGDALIGVTVMPVSGKGGTVSDIDGNFTIDLPKDGKVTLSYAGYKSLTIKLKEGMTIKMEQDLVGLEDVVVIGYGTVKKKDLTGAVTTMKTEDITIAPTSNAMEALQGKVAGLDITKSSGQVGAGVSILLRGSRSIYGDNAPLFIIDGVQGGSYEDVNPSDIESIDVLKDASSTAIYGSAGANGVIIITTKRGQEGKARVNFDAYYGFSGTPNFQHGMVGDEWMAYQREAYKYIHGQAAADDASLFGNSDYLQAYQQGKWIDWVDQIRNTATQQKYSLSVSGGTKKTKVFASAAYTKQDGLIETDNQKVYQMRLNIDQELNKWLTASFTSNLNYSNRNLGSRHTFINALKALPLGDPYTETGEINYRYIGGLTTPLGDFIKNQYAENVRTTYLNVAGSLTWSPFKGLSAKTSINGILKHSRNGKFRGEQCSATAPSYSSLPFGESSNTNNWQYNWENVISYNNTIGDHAFGGQLISSYIVGETEFARAYSNGLAMDSYQWHQLKGGDSKSYSEYQKWQKLSYAVRVNYSYKGRYLLNISNRWDGVSWFVDDNKWDMFPAVALGWRISDEGFMASAAESWLDNLKLRVGYGITGNSGLLSTDTENGISGASAYATQSIPYYFTGTGMRDGERGDVIQYNTYGSSTLGWEKSYNWNIGLDFAVLRSRIAGSIEYFHTTTKGLLFRQQVPITSGITMWGSPITTWQNLAKTKNYGVEATITSQNIQKKNFTWSTTLTATWARESIVSMPIDAGYYLDTSNGKNLFVGEAINSFYGYKYAGIWSTDEADEAAKYGSEPGLIKIETKDKDGDGGVHPYGTDDRQVLGHSNPDWVLGFTNNFRYKGFDLSIHTMARLGQMIQSDMLGRYTASEDITVNQIAGTDYWTETNQGAYFPRAGSAKKQAAYYAALTYVDGSFFKIKNITLGYTLPTELVRKAFMEKVRFYFTAYNPFILCKSILKDTDPETNGSDSFPTYREFVFGVNVTF